MVANGLMSGCTFPHAGVCIILQLGSLRSNRGMQLDSYCCLLSETCCVRPCRGS